jgi:hypothetical protein
VPREIGFFAKHTFKGKLKWLLKGYMDNIIRLPEILRKRFNRTGFVGSIVIDSY